MRAKFFLKFRISSCYFNTYILALVFVHIFYRWTFSRPNLYLYMFIIWPAPWAGKMNQILRFDWLPERARWSYLAHSGLPAVSRKKKFPRKPYNKSLIDQVCSVSNPYIFHSLFLQLENDIREIETSLFIASFYSEILYLAKNKAKYRVWATLRAGTSTYSPVPIRL